MIARQHRFHGYNSLNFVYRKGSAARADFINLRYAKSRAHDYRLAVVVSKKVSKSAVVRNRIRRRIYEIVRIYKQEADVEWPQDMIITVFEDRAATVSAQELRATISGVLQKSGL